MSQAKDSVKHTVIVAAVLCLVCSVLVSVAAVSLKPKQTENALLDRKRNILESAGLMEPGRSVDELFQNIEPRVVDLETGEFVEVEAPSLEPVLGRASRPGSPGEKIERNGEY